MANKNFVVKNGLVVQGAGTFDSDITVKGTLNAPGGISGAVSGSVDTLTNSRNFQITGDATAPNQAFDGSANVTLPLTLANSGVTAGTYGSKLPSLSLQLMQKVVSIVQAQFQFLVSQECRLTQAQGFRLSPLLVQTLQIVSISLHLLLQI